MKYIVTHRITKVADGCQELVSSIERLMDWTELCALIGETVMGAPTTGTTSSLYYRDSVHTREGRVTFNGIITWGEARS